MLIWEDLLKLTAKFHFSLLQYVIDVFFFKFLQLLNLSSPVLKSTQNHSKFHPPTLLFWKWSNEKSTCHFVHPQSLCRKGQTWSHPSAVSSELFCWNIQTLKLSCMLKKTRFTSWWKQIYAVSNLFVIILPCSINLTKFDVRTSVSEFGKRKGQSSSCVHILYTAWNKLGSFTSQSWSGGK